MRSAPVARLVVLGLALLALGATNGDDDGDDDRAPVSRVLARGPAPAEEEEDEKADGEKPAEDPLVRLDRPHHIEIRARDMRLRQSAMGRLERVAARYHASTRAHLVVTGGYRIPRRQAELMASKLAKGEDIVALYAEKGLAAEIRDAYAAGALRKETRAQLVATVLAVIEAQIERGVFVSLHLQGRAADVRSRGMTASQLEALKRAIEAEPGAVLVDERDGGAPHFHLKL